MIVIKKERPIFFDVDETLILHNDKGSLEIRDPYTGKKVKCNPHKEHIMMLKKAATIRRQHVFIWSYNGVLWANAVVKALNLDPYVVAIIPKPSSIVDDVPWDKWNPQNSYQPPRSK